MPMRKPSEYIPAALVGLRDRLMSDCTEVLRHGDLSAKVVRVGSPARGADTASDLQTLEDCRVLALAADFPRLTRGTTVEYGSSIRFVTSVRTNPTEKTLIVGMTAELEDVIWTRDASPHLTATLKAALRNRGPSQNAGNVYAPVTGDEWRAFVCFGGDEAVKISAGDTLRRANGELLTVQQARIEEHVGWVLILTTDMKGPLT